jgi:hypothetical protein
MMSSSEGPVASASAAVVFLGMGCSSGEGRGADGPSSVARTIRGLDQLTGSERALLQAIYEEARSDPELTFPNAFDLAARIGLSDDQLTDVMERLSSRELAKWQTTHRVRITQLGLAVAGGPL